MLDHFVYLFACSLYNKESVLEFILEKKNIEKFSHIRGLKDVKELNLTDNPALSRTDDKMDISDVSKYVCPVTGLEMSGKHRWDHLAYVQPLSCWYDSGVELNKFQV